MRKIIGAFVLLTVGINAVADHSCLVNATNSDLVNEVSRRLQGTTPPPPPAGATVVLSCDSYRLKISLTPAVGNEVSTYVDGNDAASCQSTLQSVGGPVISINRKKIIGICDTYRLKRVELNPLGEAKALSYMDLSNAKECATTADALNKVF